MKTNQIDNDTRTKSPGLESRHRKWELLANEAIVDAGYWKSEARKAQGERHELLTALKFLTSQIHLGKLNIRKDFSLINAHAAALYQAEETAQP